MKRRSYILTRDDCIVHAIIRYLFVVDTLHLIAIEILRIYVYFKFVVSHFLRHEILSKILENSKKFPGTFFLNSIFYIFYSIYIQ